jgi:hypothetical protein
MTSYAKKATKKQGAKVVLFEFEKETEAIEAELLKLRREEVSVYYYYSSDKGKIYIL